jgi:hypothetical protein
MRIHLLHPHSDEIDMPPKSGEALDASPQMARVNAIVPEGTLLQENPAGSKAVDKPLRRSQGIRKVLEHIKADDRVEYDVGPRNF